MSVFLTATPDITFGNYMPFYRLLMKQKMPYSLNKDTCLYCGLIKEIFIDLGHLDP